MEHSKYRRAKITESLGAIMDVKNRIGHLLAEELPVPNILFTDMEAHELLISYRKDPSNVLCPTCGANKVQVWGFAEIKADEEGYRSFKEPEGEYVSILYCNGCKHTIAICPELP